MFQIFHENTTTKATTITTSAVIGEFLLLSLRPKTSLELIVPRAVNCVPSRI
jgi:hypothetical protein